MAEQGRARQRLERVSDDVRESARGRDELRRRISELREEAARRVAKDLGASLEDLRDAEARLRLTEEGARTLVRDRHAASLDVDLARSRAEMAANAWARAKRERLEA